MLIWSFCVREKRIRQRGFGEIAVSAEPSSEERSHGAEAKPARKAWVTPTIEEAHASVVTEAKYAANGETPFSKNGS